jgi:putative serine protease PepD
VRLFDGTALRGRVLGSDEHNDIAVVKVDRTDLRPANLALRTEVQVGQMAVAIGSPFGLEQTVTTGIVSALHRQITAPNNFTIDNAIQTDAAINHGNSGGPLLDLSGKVVGVTAQIASDSGGNDGIGFAIPSNTVKSIVTQLIGSGEVTHAYLGVGVEPTDGGVAISEVKPGTPAAASGLEVGDVITDAGGNAVSSSADLQKAVDARQPGDTVSIELIRDGQSKTVKVELGVRPA